MISSTELLQLAFRIEALKRTPTHGWHPADELEFRRGVDKLPSSESLRGHQACLPEAQYRKVVQLLQHLDGLVQNNDPRNPKRMLRDLTRGRLPR